MVWNADLKREIPEGWIRGVFSDIANILVVGRHLVSHLDIFTLVSFAIVSSVVEMLNGSCQDQKKCKKVKRVSLFHDMRFFDWRNSAKSAVEI